LSFVNFQGKLTGTSRDLFACEASLFGLLCAWREVHILKGKPSNPYVVLDSVKDQLWNDVLKHFALPEGVNPNLVKGWTLVKMATQFQNFKKKLTRDFIKNNRTPNWDEYPKIKDHWKSFVEYKQSETFAQKSAQAKNSASKKGDYNHRLGRGGYAHQFPSGGRWNKTLSPKVSCQQSFTGPKDRRIGMMRMEAD
jgi:hypothetical protein